MAVLKQPGDKVKRDEPIYQMETDKAVMDVESPYEGILREWLVPVDTILPIGGEVARMEVAEGVKEEGGSHGAPETVTKTAETPAAVPASGSRNATVPPRTRAYAKEKGLSDEQLADIPSATGKLMPSDIDAFLSAGPKATVQKSDAFDEAELGSKQRLLNSRMVRGNALVVPGTIMVALNWEPMLALREKIKAGGGEFQPSVFTMLSFVVARTLKDFPGFRSTMVGDSVLRTYKNASLGIAVALPGDELVLAVVEEADALDWQGFAARMRERIDYAREGHDQANEAVTLSLTNMQSFGLRDAVPVVVPPSVATLFLGEVYQGLAQDSKEIKTRKMANLALTFDHRVINGVGAANFINAVRTACEDIESLIKP